jgi:predicted metal-dependent hydrolase
MVNYILQRRKNSLSMRISVHYDGSVVVSAPLLMPKIIIDRFVNSKSLWIENKVNDFLANPIPQGKLFLKKLGRKEYKKNKDKARSFILQRIEYYNKDQRFSFNRIFIKNQSSRWGSCSKNKNLNFSFKLLYLPIELADYVIVHELCHLSELNHSKAFWDLVAQILPDYKVLQKRLKNEF